MSTNVRDDQHETNTEIKATLAADVVLFAHDSTGVTHVLLIQRRWAPFEGCWALPGGLVEPTERFIDAARRELAEETGIVAPDHLDFVGIYDTPDRDPRGRVVSTAFVDFVPMSTPTAADDAAAAQWMPYTAVMADPSVLAFDHAQILRDAFNQLWWLDEENHPAP